MAIKRQHLANRVWIFVGDMSARTGVFHECMSYVIGHDLPVEFVVENNGLSVCTDTLQTWGADAEIFWYGNLPNFHKYDYELPWPHSGAGKRVNF